MTQLRTTVLMKTDIVGSTPQFRALLASDLQAALSAHRTMVTHLAAAEGGRISKAAGDGYWLEFPSVTGAARSAIAMHEALALTSSSKGHDRLSMRIVIGLGDTATQDGDFIGEVLALITRIEAITPPNEIYLTTAACLALTQSEIQTALVDSFTLHGFAGQIPVHRVAQRHRTHVLADASVLVSDIRWFARFAAVEATGRIERLLDTLDLLVGVAAREFAGTVRAVCRRQLLCHFPRCLSGDVCRGKAWTRVGCGKPRTRVRSGHQPLLASRHPPRLSIIPLWRRN